MRQSCFVAVLLKLWLLHALVSADVSTESGSGLSSSKTQNVVKLAGETSNTSDGRLLPKRNDEQPRKQFYLGRIIQNVQKADSGVDVLLETILGKYLYQPFMKTTLLEFILKGANEVNVSAECRQSLEDLKKISSFLFVDASAKIPAGVLQGSIAFLGSFDQCLEIEVKRNNVPQYDGQYCSVFFRPKDTNSSKIILEMLAGDGSVKPASMVPELRYDVCVPSACTKAEIQDCLQSVLMSYMKFIQQMSITIDFLGKFENVQVVTEVDHCQTRHKQPLNAGQITAISVYGILGVVILIGTTLDITKRLAEHFLSEMSIVKKLSARVESSTVCAVFLAFSMYTNCTKLFNTNTGSDSLTAINGIRFLSMSWVILGHCFYFVSLNLIGNLRKSRTVTEDFAFQAIMNATVSVDSFFFLSGLLVSYVVIRELRKNKKVNWFLYYFHRIWRLTPAYALTILLVLLFPLFGSGPYWHDITKNWTEFCHSNWWINMLYFNNVYKRKEMCMGHTWYLSNDMQFYALSPILLYLMYKRPRWGLAVNILLIFATVSGTAAIGVINEYPPTPLVTDNEFVVNLRKFTENAYITPWCRVGPYLVGLTVGYFLAVKRNVTIPIKIQLIAWSLAIACNMAVLYGIYGWNTGTKSTIGVYAFYMATHRTAWAVGLGWVTYACATGNGGIVNKLMSWKFFVPLGRLTYMAYLWHPLIQMVWTGTARERVIYTHYSWVTLFLGFLCLSYGFAVLATLCFETPFLALEKVLLKSGRSKPRPKVPEAHDNKNYTQDETVMKEVQKNGNY